MEVIEHKLKGIVEIIPKVFSDDRGFFFESFNKNLFESAGIKENFVQDNQSFSKKGVVRGLHFQQNPYAQGKLVRVITGKALDVFVDLRKSSPTFGQYGTCVLDSEKQNMVYIPAGFAHGFSALEDTIFCYKCTNLYNKASESGIIWNDPTLNINWEVETPNVSDKDKELKTLEGVISSSEIFD